MKDDNFDKFVDSLIVEKDLKGLTAEGREQIATELKNLIAEEVNRAILMELPDEKLDELDARMNEGPLSEEEMQEFLSNSGVDIPKITTKTLMYFRSFYLGGK